MARSPAHCKEAMETVVLEKTIIKLGSLLALGYIPSVFAVMDSIFV